jgi:predicted DNA-binding protein
MVKTTLFLSENLDANLAYMSLRTQKSKAELVRKAVEGFLTEHHYDPMKKPKLAPPAYD